MRRFAGIELISDRFLKTVEAYLSSRRMTMRQSMNVDVILIVAPSSTKNKDGKLDPEMHQTKKGNQWYFRMKVHAGMDHDSGLNHSVLVTASNVHDLTPAAELLQGDEEVVNGNAGYQGIAKRSEMAGTAAEFRVVMRPDKCQKLNDSHDHRLQELIETAKAHVRTKVESEHSISNGWETL